jgi:hypothetical protein
MGESSSLIALLVPYLAGAVDLFAYRHRRIVLGPAVPLPSRLAFWLFVGLVFEAFWLGVWTRGRRPLRRDGWPGDLAAIALLLVIAAVVESATASRQADRAGGRPRRPCGGAAALALSRCSSRRRGNSRPAFVLRSTLTQSRSCPPRASRAARDLRGRALGPLIVLASLARRFGLGADTPPSSSSSPWVRGTVPVVIAAGAAAAGGAPAATNARPPGRTSGPRPSAP